MRTDKLVYTGNRNIHGIENTENDLNISKRIIKLYTLHKI